MRKMTLEGHKKKGRIWRITPESFSNLCWLFLATDKNASNQVNSFIQKEPYQHFHTDAKYVSVQGNERNI